MKLEAAIALVAGDYGPSPGMLANIVFRFVLNLTAAIACWVPMRLFHKSGELSGTAMVVAMALLNLYYAVNAAIWHDDDIGSWPKGYGWCDIQLVSWIPLETLNSAAICAVVQNISKQVSLVRASELTSEEKRRNQTSQALIIFPVPLLQAILYYFVIPMRYNISGIIGCQAVFEANWVFLVFFILPCPVFAVAAAYFAALTWWRYRKINATFRRALSSSCHLSSKTGGARTKRKLYFMALTIVAPYCPMQLVFLFNNVRLGWPWAKPYSLADLHVSGWDDIDYAPSTVVAFVSMYINYIAALEVVVFFLYFGGSEEAHEMYRRYLRALGLGKVFPAINKQWQPPERPTSSVRSLWPRAKSIYSPTMSTHSLSSSTQKTHTHAGLTEQTLIDIDDIQFLDIPLDDFDLEAARAVTGATKSSSGERQSPYRSPWIFRTVPAPRFELPKMPVPVPARLYSKIGVVGPRSRSNQRFPIRPTHLSHSISPAVRHNHRRVESLEGWNPNQDPVLSPRAWASCAFDPALLDGTGFRLSAFERGSVSVRRDFSSSTGKSRCRPRVDRDRF